MMKKLFPFATVAAGVMLSGQVFAATATIGGSTTLSPTHCPVLSNNITVQLSSDVVAGFNCGQTSFVAAACHKTGTNKAQTVPAKLYDDDGDATTPMVPEPGYSNCTDTDNDGTLDSCSFNGRVGFRGNSQGGKVGAAELGDTACNATGVATLVPDSLLETGDTSATTQPN